MAFANTPAIRSADQSVKEDSKYCLEPAAGASRGKESGAERY